MCWRGSSVVYNIHTHAEGGKEITSIYWCLVSTAILGQNTYGRESPGWISLFKIFTSFLLKFFRNRNIFGNIDWSIHSGRRRAGDS